jgi:hypothetical protein
MTSLAEEQVLSVVSLASADEHTQMLAFEQPTEVNI